MFSINSQKERFMKLKYIIPSFMAVVAMLVGCSDKFEAAYLDDLRVSSSYIAVPVDGNYPAEFVVSAKGDWQIKNVPDWLTFTPMSGGAGDTKVTVSAPATSDSKSAVVKIVCGTSVQDVNVVQTVKKSEVVLSVAQALQVLKDKPSGSSARVKGIVCKIDEISPQYGNATYYLSDDGTYGADNWLEVYRGKWIDGANFATGEEFAVGDELVVEGTIVLYNDKTPEFSQGSSVVSINKSLIGIAEVEMLNVPEGKGVTEFPLEGGSVKITVSSKGNGFHMTIPEEAKAWLHIDDFGADYVTLKADANESDPRSVSVVFSTEAEGVLYSCEQALTQKGVAPAVTDVTVAEFLAAEVGTAEYRLTGVITELYASDKQGKSFYIADHTGTTLVYRAEGFIESGAKVGDVVTVVGQRGAYKESPQMVSGTLEKVNYSATAVTINEFRNLPDDKEKYYIISGTINKVAEADKGAKDDIEKYGNFDLTDTTGSVYIYGVLKGWGGAKGQFGELGLTYGDQLTIIAYKTTYKGLVEGVGVYLSSKKANQ